MRNQWLFVLALAATALRAAAPPARAAATEGVAVVELFTSEGCSSCPPADAALAGLIHDSAGRPVYALAFHVDYWDHLGWADPYADAAYSARQQRYARAFGLDSVYTPQAVVNGRREFLGSDRGVLKQAVDEALATPAAGRLTATVAPPAGGAVKVEVTARVFDSGPAGRPVVHIALVQRGLSSAVRRGENGGRTLTHENVVRAYATVTPDAAGNATASLKLPATARPADLTIIAYAARPADGAVVAATAVGMP